jgi:PTH2 family peptidyl-tRNA hydrolase
MMHQSGVYVFFCFHLNSFSDRYLLRRWEENGQPKIVVTCKNQQEMNKITEAAESVGLPTFVVADAGRTEVCRA